MTQASAQQPEWVHPVVEKWTRIARNAADCCLYFFFSSDWASTPLKLTTGKLRSERTV